jgi:glutamate-1-semialdehyde aminotransferase
MGISQELYKKAKKLIPGGTQLLSKRPEMFLPELWPAYYKKAKGCEVWDLDGKKYIDMSYMGVGSCILGYADRDVNRAVGAAINNGSMSTLNAPEEVELARLLVDLHPWAQMVRYARCGGEAMSVAVRIARAYSRKDMVLFCGYHGWHDWYLSANIADDTSLDGHLLPGLNPLGVPRALKGTAVPFNYNDTKGFIKLIRKYGNKTGVVVMEPIRNHYPEEGFLKTIRQVTKDLRIALIIDEITAGWRLNNGGAHLIFNLLPDIAVFAKGMSNGFPMAAIIGRKKVMEVAQKTFISSTYWTDRIGPAASIAAIKKMNECDVPRFLTDAGRSIKRGWEAAAKKHGVDIEVGGMDPLGHFVFKYKDPLVLKTLLTQLMLEKGFLATTAYYASYAHKDRYIAEYVQAIDEAFGEIAQAVRMGHPERSLKGPVCHSGFKRLT